MESDVDDGRISHFTMNIRNQNEKTQLGNAKIFDSCIESWSAFSLCENVNEAISGLLMLFSALKYLLNLIIIIGHCHYCDKYKFTKLRSGLIEGEKKKKAKNMQTEKGRQIIINFEWLKNSAWHKVIADMVFNFTILASY